MKVLLDTHCLLWWAMNDSNLSDRVKIIIGDSNTEVFISTISIWEVCIKYNKGKLDLPNKPDIFLKELMDKSDFRCLPIHNSHCYQESLLPLIHNDPFDRMIIAQSMVEEIALLTKDSEIKEYPIKTIW